MQTFALDQAGLLAKIQSSFLEFGIEFTQRQISTIGEKAEDFFILTNQAGQALSAEQREQLQAHLYQVGNKVRPFFRGFIIKQGIISSALLILLSICDINLNVTIR